MRFPVDRKFFFRRVRERLWRGVMGRRPFFGPLYAAPYFGGVSTHSTAVPDERPPQPRPRANNGA